MRSVSARIMGKTSPGHRCKAPGLCCCVFSGCLCVVPASSGEWILSTSPSSPDNTDIILFVLDITAIPVLQSRSRRDSIHLLDELHLSPKRNFPFQNSCFERKLRGLCRTRCPDCLNHAASQWFRLCKTSDEELRTFYSTARKPSALRCSGKKKKNQTAASQQKQASLDEQGRLSQYLNKELLFDHSTWSKYA